MTKLAVDMSSYIKTALQAGTDTKDGLSVEFDGKRVTVNSAEYGYENFTNMMLKTLRDTKLAPKDVCMVFEGISSKSKRLIIDAGYKGKRDKKPPEFYEQFQRLREFVESQWLGLGALSLCQDYAEGDDTLAYLAVNAEEDLIIASRDGDLGVFNYVNEYGATIQTYNDGLLGFPKADSEPFVHPPQYLTLYKALVGDSSDSVPGCKGFGPDKFQKLAEKYGYDGLDEMMGMLEAGTLGPIHAVAEEKEHKLLKMIVAHEADVVRCWKLVKMYPEWVNTMKHPLRIQGGKLSSKPMDLDKRLEDFYSQEWLVTAENYADSLQFFKDNMVGDEVAFDIETSTPDESDEWLANRPKAKGSKGEKVDQLGSVLTGFSFTFGANNEFTMYVSVDHADTDNVLMSQARAVIEAPIKAGKEIVIHNNFFELPVLAVAQDEDGTSWTELWKDLGARGFIPNTLDTKIESSYVNENISNGLKFRSKHHLGYTQQSYQETTQLTGKVDELPLGGKLIEVVEYETVYATDEQIAQMDLPEGTDPASIFENVPAVVTRQYKMRELTAAHVTAYGCDDTICTAALHNLYKFVMQMEHTWKVYLDVEIDASYQHAKNFIDGAPFSLEKMRELENHDTETFDEAWSVVRDYLIKAGWAGTVPPTYGADITAKQIKEAYKITVLRSDAPSGPVIEDTGDDDDDAQDETAEPAEGEAEEDAEQTKDEFYSSRVRTPSKLVALARELGHEVFASMVERCMAGEHEQFTHWVRESFSGEPAFKNSNKQLCHLLYEVMGLPIRVRGKATKIMKAKGIKEGNPKGDALALEYALEDATPEQKKVIESIKLMTMVKTRRQLYYSKYPWAVHWKTGRIHSSHNQCQTNTRRASESDVNKQQLAKDTKIEGETPRMRETIVPHHQEAVIVSLDFDSQELRVIADYSRDENMVACFVGDHKKSMHSLTGHAILTKRKKLPFDGFDYDAFNKAAKKDDDPWHALCKEYRKLGKKVNFTTEFGAQAEKLAMTMLCSVEEAQVYIDAKEAMFPGVRVWKDETIAKAKRLGFVKTKLGAIRHLRDAFMDEDYYIVSKAERQSVNFKVQSSAAEMTKLAEGRVWRAGLVYKYDCICIGPVHDELVFSVAIKDLLEFLKEAHWCMTQPYADMEIPIESSISFGPSFGEQYEIGTKPTAQAVEEGWRQMREALAKAQETEHAVAAVA